MNNAVKDIDDVDDDLFISKKPQNYIFAEKKAQDISERTSRMMLNTRALVEESEQVGQKTLENLSSQRETLERVENDLDNINSMTRSTQKHLNNMRSFFGGIKSLFSSSNNQNQTAAAQSTVPSTNSAGMTRSATIANMPMSSGNAASANSSGGPSNNSIPNMPSSQRFKSPAVPSASSAFADSSKSASDQPVDEFDANLSEIGFGLGRLKEMAMKLGGEIGDQNDMLDRITDKSERAGDSIKIQNRQMQQLLKK